MKLPKDLQKKKLISEPKISGNRLIKLKRTFKDELNSLLKRFNDKRDINYHSEIDTSYKKSSIKSHVSVVWTKEKIQITFYNKNINDLYFILKKRVININNHDLFRQMARHEYGHILSAETTYDLYPDKAKNYDIFKISREELLNMNYYEHENLLNKVSVNRLIGVFWEFLADYLVHEKIDKKPPLEFIKNKKANLEEFIQIIKKGNLITLNFPKTKMAKYDKGYDRIFLLLNLSSIFYIFNLWNDFISIFNELNLTRLLEFLKDLNMVFEKFFKKKRNCTGMKEDIIRLAEKLDKIDYKELVFKNQIINEDFKILKVIKENYFN